MTAEAKTHPSFWKSCWREFGVWYVMLVGQFEYVQILTSVCVCVRACRVQGTAILTLAVWFTMRINSPLGTKADSAGDRGLCVGGRDCSGCRD